MSELAFKWDAYPWAQGAEEQGGLAASGPAQAGQSAMMRFAAHFVLGLRALEASPGASGELDFAALEVPIAAATP